MSLGKWNEVIKLCALCGEKLESKIYPNGMNRNACDPCIAKAVKRAEAKIARERKKRTG